MPRWIFLFLFLIPQFLFSQTSLDYFLSKAVEHSPALNEYRNMQSFNRLQEKLNRAQNTAFQVSLTGDYLFAPYFNNHGDLITTDPSPEAIGYDINLFDGGLYSAQINLERNIFNCRLMHLLDRQIQVQDENAGFNILLEKHNLQKEVTDQYLNTYQSLLLVRLSDAVVSNLTEQLNLTGELVEKGFAKTQDYLLLKIELKNQTIGLTDARQNYRSNLHQLHALCGIQDTAVVEIDSVALKMDDTASESNFIQKFTLDSLGTAIQQQLFETKYQPQLNLFMNAGLNAVTIKNIQRKFGMSAGLSLSVPLYDGRQKSLTRQQSIVNQNTIGEYRRFSKRNITLQRNDLRSQIHALKQNIRDLSEQISDYRSLLQLSEKQLQQGNVSMIDHLTLLRNFVEIRKNKIETEINYQLQINNYNYWNW